MKDKKVGDAATTVPVGPPDNGTKAEPSLPPLLSLRLSFSVSPVGLRDPYDTQKKKKVGDRGLAHLCMEEEERDASLFSFSPSSFLSLSPTSHCPASLLGRRVRFAVDTKPLEVAVYHLAER